MRWIGAFVLMGILTIATRAQDSPLDKEAAEALKLLKDSKEVKKRRAALIKLEIIGARTGVVEGVVDAASNDKEEEVRREAVLVLGRMGVKGTVSVLGELLANDKSDRVREAAAMALGGKLAEQARPQVLVLGRALKDSFPPVQAAAAEALKNMRADALEAVPHMLELVRNAKGDEVARRLIIVAVSRLKELPDKQREEMLTAFNTVAQSTSEPSDVREASLEALGFLKAEKGLPGLTAGLQASEAPLRRTAMRGLVQLKEKAAEAWGSIQKVTRDTDTIVRGQAILVCGNIGKVQQDAIKELIHAAEKDFSLENRLSAIRAIGDLGKAAAEAAPMLERLVAGDVRASIRDAAQDALRKIKA